MNNGGLIIMLPVNPKFLLQRELGLIQKNVYKKFEIVNFEKYLLLFYAANATFDFGNDPLINYVLI